MKDKEDWRQLYRVVMEVFEPEEIGGARLRRFVGDGVVRVGQ